MVVGFLALLDRLAVRRVSSRHLFQGEHIVIADLRRPWLSLRAIAMRLGRLPSAISGASPSFCFGGGARNRSAAICATAFPDDPSMRRVMQAHIGLSTNRIRAFIDLVGLGVTLPRPLLRTGRDHRLAHHRQQHRRGYFQQPMLSIYDRPLPCV